ncbi:MAG: hypothetical protein ACF8PN_09435 [Phycisphaerales bacterium]
MKSLLGAVIVFVLLAAGMVVGWFMLRTTPAPAPNPTAPATTAANTGENATEAHGSFPAIPAGATLCEPHRIPELVCSFCDSSKVEEFGFCAGHEVPEAHCTRCHPILIAAFKAEGDWCAEHELPESQCTICNPSPEG